MINRLAKLEYAVVIRPRTGEPVCGDAAWVQESPEGAVLAVIDGLGHGAETVAVTERAMDVLRNHPGESLLSLAHRCHEALLGSRGVGLCLVELDAGNSLLSWIGVGEVEGLLISAVPQPFRPPLHLLNFSGVIGDRLPPLQIQVASLQPGDCLVFATAGLAPGFAAEAQVPETVDGLAESLLDHFRDASEDALVLVVRWFGAQGAQGVRGPMRGNASLH